MKFDNHPPVNFYGAEKLAQASRDGGSYDGVGWNTYTAFQGKKLHLVHSENSGCTYGSGTTTYREHLGVFDDRESLIEFLLTEKTESNSFTQQDGSTREYGLQIPWWVNELLTELGYAGAEA